MGRDTEAAAARLERLLRPPERGTPAAVGADGSFDVGGPAQRVGGAGGPPASGGGDRGRHATGGSPPRPGAWRLSGVPAGAALAALCAAAVAALLLLGGGSGAEQVVVGPAEGTVGDVAGGARASGPADPVPPPTGGGPVEGAAAAPAPGAPVAAVASVAPGASGTSPAGPSDAASGPLVVHVDGAVVRPGVVTVPSGSRVSDAVAAAGGVTTDADTRLVNLARLLADGELVVVPVPGEAPAPGPGAAGGTSAPGAAGAGEATAAAGPLDLNAADAVALDGLPGIGPVLAERIVAHREDVGPFASVDDLDAVSGIGPSLMAELRALVTV